MNKLISAVIFLFAAQGFSQIGQVPNQPVPSQPAQNQTVPPGTSSPLSGSIPQTYPSNQTFPNQVPSMPANSCGGPAGMACNSPQPGMSPGTPPSYIQ